MHSPPTPKAATQQHGESPLESARNGHSFRNFAPKRCSLPQCATRYRFGPERLLAGNGRRDRVEVPRLLGLRWFLHLHQIHVVDHGAVGHDILARQQSEGWGAKVIDRLADDLRRIFPEMTGLSARNLKYMRAFAAAWTDTEFVQRVVAQLPWGHNVSLLDTVKATEKRAWYAEQAIEHGWSRAVLVHQIEGDLFARQGSALTNFSRTLPAGQSELAQQLLKDPYTFDFLALGPDMLERDLERGLIDHLRSLILELGKGFAFVGSQYHLEVGGQDYYLDLLFYHLRLGCFVVIELKIEEFKPEFAGKMNFYLSAVDDQLKHEDDQPTIGIILCKGRNEVIVEYALRDSSKPMGVAQYRLSPALPAQYQTTLPTVEELAREFPLISVVKLRIEIERALRDTMSEHGLLPAKPIGIDNMLRALHERGLAPAGTERFLESLRVMNEAAHGLDVDPEISRRAAEIGAAFLAELTRPL